MPAVNNSARLLCLSYTPDLSTLVAGIVPDFLTRVLIGPREGEEPRARKGRCEKQGPSFPAVRTRHLALALREDASFLAHLIVG